MKAKKPVLRNTSEMSEEKARHLFELSEEKAKQTVRGLWAIDPRNPMSSLYRGKPGRGPRVRALKEAYLRPKPYYLGTTEDGTRVLETWNHVLARFIGERLKEDSPWFCPNCGALLALCQCPASVTDDYEVPTMKF